MNTPSGEPTVDPDILLQVIVRTEDLDTENQALDVTVHIADDIDYDWAIRFLHQVAEDLATKRTEEI